MKKVLITALALGTISAGMADVQTCNDVIWSAKKSKYSISGVKSKLKRSLRKKAQERIQEITEQKGFKLVSPDTQKQNGQLIVSLCRQSNSRKITKVVLKKLETTRDDLSNIELSQSMLDDAISAKKEKIKESFQFTVGTPEHKEIQNEINDIYEEIKTYRQELVKTLKESKSRYEVSEEVLY